MGYDFEIALLFTQEVIPYSLEYFLGLRSVKVKELSSDDSDKENVKKK